MPMYEYLCQKGHKTIQMRSISLPVADLDKSTCECGEPAELVISKPGRPIFVGQGFHENDYKHGALGS
jgi:hypothetical protein